MRWLVVAASAAIVAAALWLYLHREPSTGGPPLDSIGEKSEAELQEILREEGSR
jgi:hypothetical protein